MTNDEFVGKALKELIDSNITVQFNKRKYDSKNSINFFIGYEDNYPFKSELQVNYFSNDPESWFTVFLHEYGHFLQWKNERKKWDNHDKKYTKFWNAVDNPTQIIRNSTLYAAQELEIDCERKVFELADKYDLKFDRQLYIKQSNVYILFYYIFWKYHSLKMPTKAKIRYSEYFDIVPDFLVTEEEIRSYEYDLLEDKYLSLKEDK